MNPTPGIQPLSIGQRRVTFILLVALFVLVLPFLFLYATGYRLSFGKPNVFVGTGGLYVAAERTGAEIYIDGELVRETRAFRKAFYAQGLSPGTHRVHVQKEEHHTWVKELPVYAHLVTEAQAFNLPLVPDVRVISPWRNAEGVTVLSAAPTLSASTTNDVEVELHIAADTLIADTEYATLIQLFQQPATSTDVEAADAAVPVPFLNTSSKTPAAFATSTKEQSGVRLFLGDDDVFAEWVGPRGSMPYYYCAEAFELTGETKESAPFYKKMNTSEDLPIGPVQVVPADVSCDPVIRIDRQGERVRTFDFYPNNKDLIVLALQSGIYVVEVDNRAWQNIQPLIKGNNLDFRIENDAIYVYDGTLIYQVALGT